MTAIYFCVERGPGGAEMPVIIHDLLPERLTHKGSSSAQDHGAGIGVVPRTLGICR